jgi:hypothetical protein
VAEPNHLDLHVVRERLGMSQSELADYLGVSIRTVQSCEQGWRTPSAAVERAAFLLLVSHRFGPGVRELRCWDSEYCSEKTRETCLAYQTRQGHLCWLLSGNLCRGVHFKNWDEKKAACLQCDFFQELFPEGIPLVE